MSRTLSGVKSNYGGGGESHEDSSNSRAAVVVVCTALESEITVIGLHKALTNSEVQIGLEGPVLHQVQEYVALHVIGGCGAAVAVKDTEEAEQLPATGVSFKLCLSVVLQYRVSLFRALLPREDLTNSLGDKG